MSELWIAIGLTCLAFAALVALFVLLGVALALFAAICRRMELRAMRKRWHVCVGKDRMI